MSRRIPLFIIILFLVLGGLLFLNKKTSILPSSVKQILQNIPFDPLQISYLRERSYIGSDLKIEQTLASGSNYKKYIASYYSDNLKIYGLLTIPNSAAPSGGFPVIIFNHGYITPEKYTPDGNYIAYVDALSKAGYVVFKPDYRGNGKSEGNPTSTYFSSDYDVDDLNAIASIKKTSTISINKNKIGVWGHSMGGHITLIDLVVSSDIKAAVIWGGVLGSYNDILYNWQDKVSYQPDSEDLMLRNLGSAELLNKYGTPTSNSDFWNSIDPTTNLNFVNTPIQIHVGLSDTQVPPDFSENLYNKLKNINKTAEFYSYPKGNHDISSPNFEVAMKRTIEFFDRYLK